MESGLGLARSPEERECDTVAGAFGLYSAYEGMRVGDLS